MASIYNQFEHNYQISIHSFAALSAETFRCKQSYLTIHGRLNTFKRKSNVFCEVKYVYSILTIESKYFVLMILCISIFFFN